MGVSASVRSSLAFDTFYAGGQRRHVESLSACAPPFPERRDRDERGYRPSSVAKASARRAAAEGPTELTSPYWSSARP